MQIKHTITKCIFCCCLFVIFFLFINTVLVCALSLVLSCVWKYKTTAWYYFLFYYIIIVYKMWALAYSRPVITENDLKWNNNSNDTTTHFSNDFFCYLKCAKNCRRTVCLYTTYWYLLYLWIIKYFFKWLWWHKFLFQWSLWSVVYLTFFLSIPCWQFTWFFFCFFFK